MAAATSTKKNAAAMKKPAAAKKPAAEKPSRAPRRKKAAVGEVVAAVMPADDAVVQASTTALMPSDEAASDAGMIELMPADEAPVHAAMEAMEAMAEQPAPELATAAADESQPAVVKKGKTTRYLLPSKMEIASLGPVHEQLVAIEASNDGPFVLDGANLSVIDTAGLQLLISFVSAVQASGKKVSWDNYSVQAYQLANELGVVEQLGD